MSTFNIHKDTLKIMGVKTSMTVTFKSDDGRSVTQYHEIESTDKDVIEQQLQKSADEFASRVPMVEKPPVMETGKDMRVAEIVVEIPITEEVEKVEIKK